jgi:hypothetical protein
MAPHRMTARQGGEGACGDRSLIAAVAILVHGAFVLVLGGYVLIVLVRRNLGRR